MAGFPILLSPFSSLLLYIRVRFNAIAAKTVIFFELTLLFHVFVAIIILIPMHIAVPGINIGQLKIR
jgi:hypothetical protein